MPVCIIVLTLITNRPIYFNINKIENVRTDICGFGEKCTTVNTFYIKETPEKVIEKINNCKR